MVIYGESPVSHEVAERIGGYLGAQVGSTTCLDAALLSCIENFVFCVSDEAEGGIPAEWQQVLLELKPLCLSGKCFALYACGEERPGFHSYGCPAFVADLRSLGAHIVGIPAWCTQKERTIEEWVAEVSPNL